MVGLWHLFSSSSQPLPPFLFQSLGRSCASDHVYCVSVIDTAVPLLGDSFSEHCPPFFSSMIFPPHLSPHAPGVRGGHRDVLVRACALQSFILSTLTGACISSSPLHKELLQARLGTALSYGRNVNALEGSHCSEHGETEGPLRCLCNWRLTCFHILITVAAVWWPEGVICRSVCLGASSRKFLLRSLPQCSVNHGIGWVWLLPCVIVSPLPLPEPHQVPQVSLNSCHHFHF